MTFDGKEWYYTWNGENRLILASNATHVVSYAYDWRGRMVRKTVAREDESQTSRQTFVWDNLNIVVERVCCNGLTNETCNTWGLDMSGTFQGAGGVGGLLVTCKRGRPYYLVYDANGNVSDYVNSNYEIVAHRSYSAFGETTALSGTLSDSFTYWWSTKPWCPLVRLSEYEFRHYCPKIGRWLSRDPVNEIGGINLYLLANNRIINNIDKYGFYSTAAGTTGKDDVLGAIDDLKWGAHVYNSAHGVNSQPDFKWKYNESDDIWDVTEHSVDKCICESGVQYEVFFGRCYSDDSSSDVIYMVNWSPEVGFDSISSAERNLWNAVYKLILNHELGHIRINAEWRGKLNICFKHGPNTGCGVDELKSSALVFVETDAAEYFAQTLQGWMLANSRYQQQEETSGTHTRVDDLIEKYKGASR